MVVASLVLLGAAASAQSQPQAHGGNVYVAIDGWGSVRLSKGIVEQHIVRCTAESCAAYKDPVLSSSVVLTERPYKGWKFTGWEGACTNRKPKCVVKVGRRRDVQVGAGFIPVAPGLTRANPVPVGATAKVGSRFEVRVNSVEPSAEGFGTPPAGEQYFAANVTVTYTGWGFSSAGLIPGGWDAIANDNKQPDGCPYPGGPQPPLDLLAPIYSKQSETGWACWLIASSEAASLELYFGDLTPYNGTMWFAL